MKDFKNMKDADFDKLFSESADQSVPDFEESSWEKMAVLLDETEGPKGIGWKKPLIYSGIILLLLSISYLGFKGLTNKRISGLESVSSTSSNLEASAKKGAIELSLNDSLGNAKGSSEVILENSKKDVAVKEVPAATSEEVSLEIGTTSREKFRSNKSENKGVEVNPVAVRNRQKVGEKLSMDGESSKKLKTRLSNVNRIKEKTSLVYSEERLTVKEGSTNNLGGSPSIELEFRQERSSKKLIVENNTVGDELGFKNGIRSLTKMDAKPFRPFTHFSIPVNIKAPEKVVKENDLESLEKGFGLRIAFSPDFSVVPENSFFKIGHNWAALLEYRFNNKWSIQTGVIKSLKYYQASPAQYKWPEAWGESPAELNQIDARCSMIDIPLNIRYDFTTSRNRWFAQAGLTSYLMLKENYDYIFASNYKDQVWKSWEGKTGFYPAGVINLSGGVEKRIFRKMAIQIEPFFKVPIAKVGYGKVKLATAGLFISTKLPLSK